MAETGSTNADLLSIPDAPDRTVLVAGHQTAGRGRLDRRWDAPPGVNLLTSILFQDVPDPANELTRRVGLAVIDAVRACMPAEPRLKWPNDVLLEGGKLAGILSHRSPAGARGRRRRAQRRVGARGARRMGEGFDPIVVLAELLRALAGQPADVHDRYRDMLDTLGRRVRVDLPSGSLSGTAVDVERDGRLVVVDECAISHRIDVGDIVHLRAAPEP